MAIEETFSLTMTDSDAETIFTIGDLKRYVQSHVRQTSASKCYCQRAFYRIRADACDVLDARRSSVRPRTLWTELLPSKGRRRAWKRIVRGAGVPHLEYWKLPFLSLAPLRRWDVPVFRGTVGSTAYLLAAMEPLPQRSPGAPWSRDEISRVIDRQIVDTCGISDFSDDVMLVD